MEYISLLRRGRIRECPPPSLVVAVLEQWCNLQCTHCYWAHRHEKWSGDPKASGSIEDFSSQIEQIVTWNADVVCSGRVLTHRVARFIKDFAARSGKKAGVVDNGYYILKHPELWDLVEYIDISIDGTDEDHDRQRGKAGSAEVAWNAIRVLEAHYAHSKNPDRVVVSSCVSPLNIGRYHEFEAALRDEHIMLSCTPVLQRESNRRRNMPMFDPDGLNRAVEKLLRGIPKLLYLYDPGHVEALLPLLGQFQWRQEKPDCIETVAGNVAIIYKPTSVQILSDRPLMWDGRFYTSHDSEALSWQQLATNERILETANLNAERERRLVEHLLGSGGG